MCVPSLQSSQQPAGPRSTQLQGAELDSLMGLVRSQLDVSIARDLFG